LVIYYTFTSDDDVNDPEVDEIINQYVRKLTPRDEKGNV
jgi:hypothetical protein